MDDPYAVNITARCECGHEFRVPLVGKDPETMEFTCPACGKVDRFTPDQAASIVASYEEAKQTLAKAVSDTARNLFKG